MRQHVFYEPSMKNLSPLKPKLEEFASSNRVHKRDPKISIDYRYLYRFKIKLVLFR